METQMKSAVDSSPEWLPPAANEAVPVLGQSRDRRRATGGWAYDVRPAEVQALRHDGGWGWRVVQEVVIADASGSCRACAELEIDGPSGRPSSLRHRFETSSGACIDVATLGLGELDAVLRAIQLRTVRAIQALSGVELRAEAEQVYKLAAALDHLCREAVRGSR